MDEPYYRSSLQHILAELERLDFFLQAQVQRARQLHPAENEFQGLYISEQEVEALLQEKTALPRWRNRNGQDALGYDMGTESESEIARRKAESVRRGITLRLDRLAQLFQLTPFDVGTLLVCLAPELDLRYERLYAYLHDDVTRKRPSVDLVLNLLCPSFEAKLGALRRFSPSAPLFKHRLVHLLSDPSQQDPPRLANAVKLDERITNYLLDSNDLDARLLRCARIIQPNARLDDLLLSPFIQSQFRQLARAENARGILYLQGVYGVGKQTSAEALCRELGVELLVVDGKNMPEMDEKIFESTAKAAVREALLQDAALYWDGFDVLLAEEKRPLWTVLWQTLLEWDGLVFLSGTTPWEPRDVPPGFMFQRIEFARPNHAARVELWSRFLDGAVPTAEINQLAVKFRLSGGEIRDAAVTAVNLARARDAETVTIKTEDLYAASRLQSNRNLAALARQITPHYQWADIVLPTDRLQQLREVCNHVKYRARVFDDWGFEGKLALGKGLNVLFAGPSGTGKTMAAEIVAGELGLDLYKIDLSTVVSKYIGETEKNLARIFSEAETSNAILFFDEADALFGKRSEVRDSHDRYANLEIAYLLQRMEEYDGVVILATNLRKNMDDAFVRRMHFTVEFPFPDEQHRRRIWEQIWPHSTPRDVQLDLDWMARRFELAGGSIRNIALAAAFLAADNGAVVNMSHLIHATKREYQKMGKVVVGEEFVEYAEPGMT